MGTLGSQVMCDNIPGLVNKQRQLCRRHPKVMRAIGAGMQDWISECQHQFRDHRWNCNTTARDHNLFGRLLLRSECGGGRRRRRRRRGGGGGAAGCYCQNQSYLERVQFV